MASKEREDTIRALLGELGSVTTSICQQHCAWTGCANSKNLQKCGKCGKVYYCSKECQKAHWSCHKLECSALAASANRNQPVSGFQALSDKAVKLLNKYGFGSGQWTAEERLEKGQKLYELSGQLLDILSDPSFHLFQVSASGAGNVMTVAFDGIKNYVSCYTAMHRDDNLACLTIVREARRYAMQHYNTPVLPPVYEIFYLYMEAKYSYLLNEYPRALENVLKALDSLAAEQRMYDGMMAMFPNMAAARYQKQQDTDSKVESARQLGHLCHLALGDTAAAHAILAGSPPSRYLALGGEDESDLSQSDHSDDDDDDDDDDDNDEESETR